MKKYWVKIGCITSITAMGLVPGMSSVQPTVDQLGELPKIVKYTCADGELKKAVVPPLTIFDATYLSGSVSIQFNHL